jgi:formylglycine-generating enzyme required for sulfatase activity/TolB-like protein
MKTIRAATILVLAALVFAAADQSGFAQAAGKLVAVLELNNKAGLTDDEADFLTNNVRNAASEALSAGRFVVMTRENIETLLPPGMDLKKCTESKCEIEMGRRLGAEYIITGEILNYGGKLRVQLKLHHVPSQAYLHGANTAGGSLEEQDSRVSAAAREILTVLLQHARVAAAPQSAGTRTIAEGRIGGEAAPWTPGSAEDVVVQFESSPDKATVEIGDQPVCETPCSRALALGQITVAMKKLRYAARRETIEVKAGMKPVNWTLSPNFGWLSVTSDPAGLTVKLNGKEIGKTPLANQEIDPGAYEVVVADPRYEDAGERLNLNAGDRRTVAVKPTPRQGAIKVQAVDAAGNAVEGDVLVDAQKAGKTYAAIPLLIGLHHVEVRAGAGAWQGQVEVKEKQVVAVPAKLAGSASASPTAGSAAGSGSTAGMVRVPGGTFLMGCSPGDSECYPDESPAHQVTVNGFSMDAMPVTQAQYQSVIGSNPSHFSGCADCPVETVSWYDAQAYCAKAGKRLPTEAEWEFAARGGTTGSRYGDIDAVAWYGKNSGSKTHPVGRKQANAYGLYDMLGNVWEWCADWYDDKYYSSSTADNPKGPSSGTARVLRGGSWDRAPGGVRASARAGGGPGGRLDYFGFRCARD